MPGPLSSRSDRDLLHAIATDVDAFEELYRRYELVIATFLVRRCSDPELAADLTTETFAAAVVNASKFRGDGHVAGWLIGIARNALLETWRRGKTEQRARNRLGIDPADHDPAYERVEALADIDAARPRLHRALARLPDDQREAITAHVLHDQPYPELAHQLGVPEATVRQRVSRGLSRLRTTLEGPQR